MCPRVGTMAPSGSRVRRKTRHPLAATTTGPRRRAQTLADRVVVVCIVAWAVPVIASLVRAAATDWYPVFDQALIAVGARDVLTEHHRWIGTVASVSLKGVLANHPGPLQFDLVAVPVRLFGSGIGLAVGVATVNFAAGLVSIIAAARQAGRGGAVATTVGLCLLVWSAGNQVLIDAYNPTASMVPFFAVLVLTWTAVNGDRWALLWLVGWASFCVQTNIAYVVTTLPIVAGAIGIHVWRLRKQGGGRRALLLCGLVGLLLWVQPLLEQVAGGSDGNMARLVRNVGNLEAPLGLTNGTRRTAAVLSIWPGWGRGNFDGGYTGLFEQLPPLGRSVLALCALLAVLIGCAYTSVRWLHDSVLASLLAAAAAFVVVGWVGTMRVPLSPFFGFAAAFVRWLWPIGTFSAVAIGLFVGRALHQRLNRRAVPAAVAAALVAAVIAVPAEPVALGSRTLDTARPVAVELNGLTVERLPSSGVTVDFRPPEYSLFTLSLVAALQEHGTPFAVTDDISLRQYDERRPPARSEWPVVFIGVGFEALDHWDTGVACASRLDADQRDQLRRARDAISQAVAEPGFTLSEVGVRFSESHLAPAWMADIPMGLDRDAPDVVEKKDFASVLDAGLLVSPPRLAIAIGDFVALRSDLEVTTACVFQR
jgi:hypothetical protein